MNNTTGIYIKSIEASIIWEATYRNSKLKESYDGFIPYSLESIKLRSEGVNEFAFRRVRNEDGHMESKRIDINDLDKRTVRTLTKFYTDDIINIRFSSKVHNASTVLTKVDKAHKRNLESMKAKHLEQLKYTTDSKEMQAEFDKKIEEFTANHEARMQQLKQEIEDNKEVWEKEVSLLDLRTQMYENGFTMKDYKGQDVHYVPYKRSSAKARTGQIWFIREELAETMITWSRMGIDFKGEVDIPSLGAYESLVASSIKGTVKINPKNIFIIDDVESVFNITANVIEKITVDGEDQLVSNVKDNQRIANSLFDGQGLLDAEYFTGDYEGKGMMLLRQHMFKSCMFNANVAQFLKDQFGEEYETATLVDYTGTKMKVKDIKCITTPSSLKVFKFSKFVGTDADMYKHWKNIVKSEKNVFGVCKNESSTKLGYKDGMPLNQMSYQMVNSLGLDAKGMQELSKNEVDYINLIKTDTVAFVNFLRENSTIMNAHDMIIDLWEQNEDFAKTEIFNTYRLEEIQRYMQYLKKGKIRIVADYTTMVGNPIEMLMHAVGKLDLDNPTLKGNEICTPLFKDGEEVAGFRNPHTGAMNIGFQKNTHNELVMKYMNLSNNIAAINVIGMTQLDVYSGMDFDSDTIMFTSNSTIVEIARNNEELVCLNGVDAQKNSFEFTPANRAKVDKAIASDVIGRIVNVGQLAQSVYFDTLANGETKIASRMKEVIEVISVASTIAIDLAKRTYAIDIEKELVRLDKYVKKHMQHDKDDELLFPMFMSGKGSNRKTARYDTSMDYLIDILTVAKNDTQEDMTVKVKRAKELKSSDMINTFDLVRRCDDNGEIYKVRNANSKQENEIIELITEHALKLKAIHSAASKVKGNDKEFLLKESFAEELELEAKMKKKTIKDDTIYAIMFHLFEQNTIKGNTVRLMNAVYMSNPKNFVNMFLQK